MEDIVAVGFADTAAAVGLTVESVRPAERLIDRGSIYMLGRTSLQIQEIFQKRRRCNCSAPQIREGCCASLVVGQSEVMHALSAPKTTVEITSEDKHLVLYFSSYHGMLNNYKEVTNAIRNKK